MCGSTVSSVAFAYANNDDLNNIIQSQMNSLEPSNEIALGGAIKRFNSELKYDQLKDLVKYVVN